MLEPTKKKDTPRPKTKEKLQWNSRRGAITIKSNPIPIGWAAHKLENNTTKEVLSLFWKFWDPCQASQPRDLAKDLRIPRECDFAGQQDLIIRLPQDWGKQSWRAQINYCVHQDPRERGRDPAGGWFRPACWQLALEGLLWSVGQQWPCTRGQGHCRQQSGDVTLDLSPTIEPVDSRTGSPSN